MCVVTTTAIRLLEAAAYCLSRVCPLLVAAVRGALAGLVAGVGSVTGGSQFRMVRTNVRHVRAEGGRTSTCVVASGRAEGVPEDPALLKPTTPERLCPNTRQHWVDVTQEHHLMSEHPRTSRLRLVDPDELIDVDPFAAPVLRHRAPGPALRPVPRTPPQSGQARAPDHCVSAEGTGSDPAQEREKPS